MVASMKVKGVAAVQRKLAEQASRAQNLTPIMKVVAEDVHAAIVDAFRGEKSAIDGTPWAPLKLRTIAHRRNRKTSSIRILYDTGRLFRGAYAVPTQTGINLGDSAVYGKTHQFGRGRIPARPFLPVVQLKDGTYRLNAKLQAAAEKQVKLWVLEGKLS